MKRKTIIYLVAIMTFLSAASGLASLLATTPDSTDVEPSVQIQQNHTEQTPVAIAGNSWGGRPGSGDDTKKNPPGGGEMEGNSWGG
jgi:hypothetical protein